MSDIESLLGLGIKPEDLGIAQAAARAALIYVVALFLVRLAKKRFMGRGTAFDVIVSIIIGSIAGRAITGNALLGTASAGIAVIILLHWLFSSLALRWHGFGTLIKGRSRVLIRNGVLDERLLAREHLTHRDLDEDLRQKGRGSLDGIMEGRIERDGQLSVVAEDNQVRIVDISIEDGVQRVRLEIR
jgi:uncharacterized membrane protein YcaP (DUF421 family)